MQIKSTVVYLYTLLSWVKGSLFVFLDKGSSVFLGKGFLFSWVKGPQFSWVKGSLY